MHANLSTLLAATYPGPCPESPSLLLLAGPIAPRDPHHCLGTPSLLPNIMLPAWHLLAEARIASWRLLATSFVPEPIRNLLLLHHSAATYG